MGYDLSTFVADCRTALKRDPGPAGREHVRRSLERLLRDKEFLARHFSDAISCGLYVLHDDSELGFQVLAHLNEEARVSPPHDHGASWAVYGQAVSYTDMTEYERVDEGATPGHAALRVKRRYRLNPGEVGIYQDGAIHSIDYPRGSRFIRVTGTDPDTIERRMFDPKTGEIRTLPRQPES